PPRSASRPHPPAAPAPAVTRGTLRRPGRSWRLLTLSDLTVVAVGQAGEAARLGGAAEAGEGAQRHVLLVGGAAGLALQPRPGQADQAAEVLSRQERSTHQPDAPARGNEVPARDGPRWRVGLV